MRIRVAAVGLLLSMTAVAHAQPGVGAVQVLVDRAVVRFDAPETGGITHPRFVFGRELAFEARLEALADADRGDRSLSYADRHVRSALERHVAEELLASSPMDPEPRPDEIARRTQSARAVLEQRVGGAEALARAAAAEGIDASEVDRLVTREARASLYLDRMVAPMLEPSDAELREVHRATNNPFRGERFDDVVGALRKWYVGERLETALAAFYQNAQGRVHVVVIPK
jgi:hypothetical protein